MAGSRVKVLMESGKTKVFAVALDWPGWARSGKTGEVALETLEAYAPRYAEVVGRAGEEVPGGLAFAVVERLRGSGATDFGIPHEVAAADSRRWTGREAERQIAIFGRDRDPVLRHVLGAEAAYGRSIGVKHKEPELGDEAAITAMRADIVEILSQPSSGQPIGGAKGWPARYAVRRIVWHVLDHAWEIQDKTG